MDKWFKDILPDKDPYYNRGRDQMRKKGVRNSSACVSNVLYVEGNVRGWGGVSIDHFDLISYFVI